MPTVAWPRWCAATSTPEPTTAEVASSGPGRNTFGERRIITSRIAPPPTAVMVPSRTAGSAPSPTSSVFSAPATAQQPSAAASTNWNARCHGFALGFVRSMTAAPANATSRYAGSVSAAGGPCCSSTSRAIPPPRPQMTARATSPTTSKRCRRATAPPKIAFAATPARSSARVTSLTAASGDGLNILRGG